MKALQIRFQNSEQSFSCEPGDGLLRSALRAGVGLPYECASGGCGVCRVQLIEGEVEDLWPQAPGLPQRQRDRGFRLACQSRPLSDCTMRVRAPLRGATTPRPLRRVAKLVSRTDVTSDMCEFTFAAENAAEFVAGQFALLGLPGVRGDRAYSMSNLPNSEGRWSFVIKRLANGSGSTALFDRLSVGDTITLDGPYGLAYLRDDSPRNIVGIAGGSGLSPLLSILSAAARTRRPGRRLSLFYGGRQPSDLCVPAMIDRDPEMLGRVECVTAISDGAYSGEWNGERGFIHDVVRRRLERDGDPAGNDYYFCGPPVMTDAVQRMLLDLHVPTAQTFHDRFL